MFINPNKKSIEQILAEKRAGGGGTAVASIPGQTTGLGQRNVMEKAQMGGQQLSLAQRHRMEGLQKISPEQQVAKDLTPEQ